jgi:hypothetical protein
MTRKTTTKNLVLSEAEKASLRSIAREWGFTIGRGSMKDEGSIDQLVTTIATGDALWVPIADDTEYFQVARLRELAKSENLSILARLATALERADELYHGEK